jgi:hypothetical protein
MNEPDELSRLYREAARQEPPQALDEAILAASRRAAGDRPHALRPARHWTVPLALAATVVLTFSVTVMVHEEQQADKALLSLPDRAPVPAKSAPTPQTQPQEAKSSVAIPKAETAAVPSLMPKSAPAGQLAAPARQKSTDALQDAPSLPASPVPATQGAASQPVPTATENLHTEPAEAERRAPAPALVPAPRSDFGATQPAPALRKQRMQERSLEQSPDISGAVRSMTTGKTPEQWLAEIRALKRDGHGEEAVMQLAEFKRRFPEYRLSDDLK